MFLRIKVCSVLKVNRLAHEMISDGRDFHSLTPNNTHKEGRLEGDSPCEGNS